MLIETPVSDHWISCRSFIEKVRSEPLSLRKKCPYSELFWSEFSYTPWKVSVFGVFWSAFSYIQTEYGEKLVFISQTPSHGIYPRKFDGRKVSSGKDFVSNISTFGKDSIPSCFMFYHLQIRGQDPRKHLRQKRTESRYLLLWSCPL